MRIGIDASRAFVDEPTGTERYSFELITRLMTLPEAKKHEWILYIRPNLKFEIRNLKLNSNCKIQIVNLPVLWTQVGLAYRTWVDRLDVLWVPAHTLPVFRKPSVKTVVTIHGIEYEWLPAYESRLQRWYLPLSTKYAVKFADRIVAVSKFTKAQLVERLGASADKIQVVYEGVADKFKSQISNDKLILAKFKLQSKKYLLFIGTIQPRKNLERLIEVFLKLKILNLKLVICGKWGWGYEKLRDVKDKRIIFTGYVSDEERQVLLQNALVYVQPSITEGFGLPILEAMQAGVPVVSSSGGALSEVVGEAGLLFDPYDVCDISNKLSLAINGHFVAGGTERVKKFSWDNAARETYKILSYI